MEAVLTWLSDNWWWIASIAIPVLLSVVNAVTKHWSGNAGVLRWGGLIIELLSLLTSKDARTVAGRLKLPLTSVRPKRGDQ